MSLICFRCQSRIEHQLSDLIGLWNDAHGELLPGAGGSGGGSEQSIGVNVAALSFINGADIWGMLGEWEEWTRTTLELAPVAIPAKPRSLKQEMTRVIYFTLVHLTWMATQDQVLDFMGEVADTWQKGNVAAKRFTEKMRRINCPSDDASGLPCGRSLRLYPDDILRLFTCPGCHSEWSTLRVMMVALESPGDPIWTDIDAVALFMRMSTATALKLGKSEKIAHRGHPRFGQQWDLRGFYKLRDRVRIVA
jgi:hypothetical protein